MCDRPRPQPELPAEQALAVWWMVATLCEDHRYTEPELHASPRPRPLPRPSRRPKPHQVHGARVVRCHLEHVRHAARPWRHAQGDGAPRLPAPSRDRPQRQPDDLDLLHSESRGPAGVAQ